MNKLCKNCKHYVDSKRGCGLCIYSLLLCTPVREFDYCECYEKENERKENE